MSTAAQVDGLAGALLRCVEEPERIPLLHVLLDRYSHRLRNRLNSMKLSLYLARRLSEDPDRADWGRADTAYRSMEAMIEQVQQFCNPLKTIGTEGDLSSWVEGRVPGWRHRLGDRPMRIEAEGPSGAIPCRMDWALLGQGVDALVAFWADQGAADGTLRVGWGREGGQARLRFEAECSLIRPRGEAENLALPMLARMLRAHQGCLRLLADAAVVELIWPAC